MNQIICGSKHSNRVNSCTLPKGHPGTRHRDDWGDVAWGGEFMNTIPTAADLDAVAEEERVRMATRGTSPGELLSLHERVHQLEGILKQYADALNTNSIEITDFNLMRKLVGIYNDAAILTKRGTSPVTALIDAAMQLAVGRIHLDPQTTAPDHLATAFCSECYVRAEAFDRLQHAPYCLVGQIFAAVASLEGGSRPVTGRNERHVELFPVEHPTATELA